MRFRLIQLTSLLVLLPIIACRPPAPPAPKASPIPVTTELLEAGPFRASMTLLGVVEPSAVVELRTPAAGTLRYEAGALATGRRVSAGQLLFRIESPELQLRRREAELQARSADNELERTRRGVEGGFLPEADLARREIEHELALERLAGAKEAVERLAVRAPISGRLKVDRPLLSGAEVDAQTVIVQIDSEGRPQIEAWATSGDLERLSTGLEIEARSSSGQLVGRGRLSEIDARLDASGVARVVASIDEDIRMPAAGDGAELVVLLEAKTEVVSVPSRALIVDGSLLSVFVLEPQGRLFEARARPVVAGGRQGDRVEILEGLAAGERVAVDGADLLADGLPVKDVEAEKKKRRGAA